MLGNIEASGRRGLPELVHKRPHDGIVCIVGGGPSLKDNLHILRAFQRDLGAKVWAINGAHDWLRDQGINPDAMVMVDARPENVRFVSMPVIGTTYYLGPRCHPDVFDALEGAKVVRLGMLEESDCGTTSGTWAMCAAWVEGYNDIRLFGFDSSYRDDDGHAYAQSLNDGESVEDYWCGGKKYRAAVWMAQQVVDFQNIVDDLKEHDCVVRVYGDGLLPEMARQMADPEGVHRWKSSTVGTVFYDLAHNPPTFNFVDFLLAAEGWRRSNGFEKVDIKILPGPKDGFRDDDLPPYGRAERMRWLENICIPLPALLPSCGKPAEIVARDYRPNGPHFGKGRYMVGLPTAVAAAQQDIYPLRADGSEARRCYGRYVTITLRNPGWWKGRQTAAEDWLTAADEIRRLGYVVVLIPDGSREPSDFLGLCGHAVDELASTEVLRRAQLYAGAEMNLGITSGPMELSWFLSAPTIIFVRTNEEERASSVMAYEKAGLPPGSQFANAKARQRWVWAPDTAENILAAFRETMREES